MCDFRRDSDVKFLKRLSAERAGVVSPKLSQNLCGDLVFHPRLEIISVKEYVRVNEKPTARAGSRALPAARQA